MTHSPKDCNPIIVKRNKKRKMENEKPKKERKTQPDKHQRRAKATVNELTLIAPSDSDSE